MCPACQKGHEIAESIKKKFGNPIHWVFKDFPLEQHEGADRMAEAAHCANDQGKFWQYQDFLFSSEKKPGPRKN
jgi:protein-disulfide isomerase